MTTELVDRRSESASLLDHLENTVRTGRPAVVLVNGEAGVGKTRLLNHFAERAAERHADAGLLVGYGQAMMNSLESDAYQAIRECLRALAQSAQRSGSRELTTRVVESFRLYAPDWIESVPVVGKLLAAGMLTGRNVVQSRREGLEMDSRLDQLVRFVADLVGRGPVLLVLDDLHWADTATIDLLVTLALRVEGPLLLVLAYRPDDLQGPEGAETHPLRRAIFRLRRYSDRCAEVDLERLSGDDTALLVRANAGDAAVSTRLVERIVAQSDGNPLFAESLFRVGEAVQEQATASMPRQIKAILEERLSFLMASDQRLLESAALIGYSFEVAYLAALARLDVDDVYERLDTLLNDHGLVKPADPRGDLDRYRVHHPLLAEVLRERGRANGPRWRRQHQKLLEILQREQGTWDEEMHVRAVSVAVGAGDRARACELALAAAQRQFELGAVSKAHQLARVAIEHGRDGPAQVIAHHLLAECLYAEGSHARAVEASARAMDLARALPERPPEWFALQLLRARALRMTNSWRECAALLADLDDQCRAADAREKLAEVRMLEAEMALCGPVQDTAECMRLCSLVSDMTADAALQARALGHRGLAHLADYDPGSAEVWLSRSIETARERDHPYAEYEAVHWLSKKAIACLELDIAWHLLEELARTSDVSGVASESPFHLRDSSRVLALRERPAESAVAFARYVDSCLPPTVGRATMTLCCQIDELEVLFDRAAADALIQELAGAADREITDPEQRSRLQDWLVTLLRREPGWAYRTFAVEVLGVDRTEAEAADAIFRFDVPDLAVLRGRTHRRG